MNSASLASFTFVRIPDNANDDKTKTTICHIPPGNPANAHTITIAESAWRAHKKHGDYQGECQVDTYVDVKYEVQKIPLGQLKKQDDKSKQSKSKMK